MNLAKLKRVSDFEWRIAPVAGMYVPAVIYADENLIRDIDDKVYEQVTNVARLPGIVKASYAMPDAHWGYASRSVAWPPSTQNMAVLSRPAVSASISHAACELC